MSYVSGASELPLLYRTVGEVLESAAQCWPTHEALLSVAQGLRFTYAELNAAADGLAARLLGLGLGPGDRVGIWSPNCAEWVITQFATAKAGLILVTINPAYRLIELEYALNKVECRALVMARRFKSSDYVAMMRDLARQNTSSENPAGWRERIPSLQHVVLIDNTGEHETPVGMVDYRQLVGNASKAGLACLGSARGSFSAEHATNIQFTSGTTGPPKGATLTHHNIVNNGFFTAERMRLTHRDRLCIAVPLYHCFGMVMGVLGCATHGATMVLPGEGFEAESVLRAIEAERCTALYGVPTMFIAELSHPQFAKYDLTSLRTGIMAGAPCPVEVMKRVLADMHMHEVTIAYGMTETSPVSFQSSTDETLDRRVSTVGRVHPHIEAKVIDLKGRVVPRGTSGELLTRGYSVMSGYWNDSERTREVVDADGWMHTGDLAVIDAEGYCNIVGRLKDIIIRGGENISPYEVEEYLYRHPKIQAVQVFGVPDARLGEAVCAWVQLRPGAVATDDEIREFCRGQLAHFKVPQYVRFVNGFPMTVTGKVQKYAMRNAMKQQLGLVDAATA